jgi:four helix bundle protein
MQNEKEKFKKDFIKRIIRFSLNTINLCNSLHKDKKYWVICDQLIRSATSIGANIVEAKSSSSRRDYIKFFEIALKSANETKYWLILMKELSVHKKRIDELLREADEISKIIGSSVLTLKGKKSF